MADLSKEDLKKEIAAILKDADLATISSKKVRQQIEEKCDVDLAARKKEVDELVMSYIEKNESKKGKKNGTTKNDDSDDAEEDDDEEQEEEDDEEEEEEEEEEVKKKPKRAAKKPVPLKRKKASSDESDDAASDDEGDDDDYTPKKKTPAKKAKGKKGKKSKKDDSDDGSDEDWGKKKKAKKAAGGAKRGGGGYTKQIKLSPELAALVGQEEMARHEVVKAVWGIIKERNLYDPKNKQFAICDDELLKVIGVKRFRTFGMMKFLKSHFLG